MSFLAPAAFALLALLPVIIAMYLLKVRRETQVVSSVYLWQRMVRDLEANAPWQRLRRNLLLFLQLLFLAFLIFALARPATPAEGPAGQMAIIIIDTSASMSATDAIPTRLDAAKAQALRAVDDLPDDARVTVIAAGERAQVLVPSSQDARQVREAIDSLQPGAGGSNLAAALQLASAVAARQPDASILVYSDGGVTLPARINLQGNLQYFPIGTQDNNQAISLVTLEPAPGGKTLNGFIQVSNFSNTPLTRRLLVSTDGFLVNAYDLDLPARGQQAVLVEGLPITTTRTLEARLDGEDLLKQDDRAWAVFREIEPANVMLVTYGNRFLETALSLLPGVQVTRVSPLDLPAALPTGANSPDLVLFDGVLLTSTLDLSTIPGDFFFLGPIASTLYFSVTGIIEQPLLAPATPGDPLLQDVDLQLVSVFDAAAIPLPAWANPIISGPPAGDPATAGASSTWPMLFAGNMAGKQVAVLAFDLRRSDLVLQVSFPILLANLVNWFLPGQGSAAPLSAELGAPVRITPLLDGRAEVEVFSPSGKRVRLPFENGQAVFTGVDEPGLYTVRWSADQQAQFAVNGFVAQEADLQTAGFLPLAGTGAETAGTEAREMGHREWWRPLAALALVLLVAEWLVYHRGTLSVLLRRVRFPRIPQLPNTH